MSRLIALTLTLGLLTASPLAHARGVVEDTCIECEGCMPFEGTIEVEDFDISQTLGVPSGVYWTRIHGLYPYADLPTRGCADEDDIDWADVTFEVVGNSAQMSAIRNLLSGTPKGGSLRGSITINYVNPDDPEGTLWVVEMSRLTLIRYSPGLVADVEHPSLLKASFTVTPGQTRVYNID